MVGAEGFEGSFPSDRYAVFFVEFDCKITQFKGFARILRRILLFQIFSPMDNFSQEIRITSYHLIAPKFVQISVKVGAEGTYHSAPESVQSQLRPGRFASPVKFSSSREHTVRLPSRKIENTTDANRNTIKVHVKKLAEQRYLVQAGKGRGVRYTI
jgi:hypothetical protein